MKSNMQMRPIRGCGVLAALTLLAGCEQDDLAVQNPRITVCPGTDRGNMQCNVGAALGEQPVGVAQTLTLHVFNDGDGTLKIQSVTSRDPELLAVREVPGEIGFGGHGELTLELTARELGPTAVVLSVESNDERRSPLDLIIDWVGVPPPAPRIVICPEGAVQAQCGAEAVVRFDGVRRGRVGSRGLTVTNVGNASLDLMQAEWRGSTAQMGELAVGTSISTGSIAPGSSIPVVLIYTPADGVADEAFLVIRTNDPEHPEARIHVLANSFDDRAPQAVARAIMYDTVGGAAVVGRDVWLDGSESSDPQLDPISFSWSLASPPGSLAGLAGASATAASFVPDVVGNYLATLVVTDSLGQTSAPATVSVVARKRYALRAVLDWDSGGDVDVHLLGPGGALFADGDCYFADPRPRWGSSMTSDDDPWLIQDAETAPGHEEIAMVEPAPGTYALFAHYLEDYGQGATAARATLILDEQTEAASQWNVILPTGCTLWHVADVTFPGRVVVPVTDGVSTRCF